MTWSAEKLRDFFFHYDSSNPNHVKAVDLLQAGAPDLMKDEADWVTLYRKPVGYDQSVSIATPFIASFEGFSPTVYKCPAGVYTIGYGTTHYPDGTLVYPGDPSISEKTGQSYLSHEVEVITVPALASTIPTWADMNPNQQAAIISFGYNLGAYFYGSNGFATITEALRTKENWHNVPSALLLYVNPGSSFEAGLRRRRQAEGDLWLK